MDYGLFLNIATTGNDTKTGHRCPVLMGYCLWKFSTSQAKLTDSYCIMPDERIMAYSSVYTGLTLKQLEDKCTMPLDKALSRIATLIKNVANKNIYIIGWNVLEDTLDVLDSNTKRLSISSFDMQKLKVIDLKRLAAYVLPIDEVGKLGPDSAYFWLIKHVLKLQDDECLVRLRDMQTSRWRDNFCKATLELDKQLLILMMMHADLKTIDDVYAWLEAPHLLDVLPFGKYKGERIADVYVKDNDYLCWLMRSKDIMAKNKDLKYSLDLMFAETQDNML